MAPQHAQRMKDWPAKAPMDGVIFHRVIGRVHGPDRAMLEHGKEGANMAPRGPPARLVQSPTFRPSFSKLPPWTVARCAAARRKTRTRPTASFFIQFSRTTTSLNGQYTVYGRLIGGMDHGSTRSPAASRRPIPTG